MHPNCRAAIDAHLQQLSGDPSKKATDAQIKRIEARFKEGGKVLARQDRAAWNAKSVEDRTIAIGKWVTDQEKIDADGAARSKIAQLNAINRNARQWLQHLATQKDTAGKHGRAVIDLLEGVDNTMRGAELMAVRDFEQLLKPAHVGDAFVDFGNRKSDPFFEDAVREIYGVATGNAGAKQFATAWTNRSHGYIDARNRAGGTVGKLEHYAPQTHNPTIMQRNGNRERWEDFMMQRLDREQYLTDDGVPLNDAELRPVVSKMYDTIVQDGGNKIKVDTGNGTGPHIGLAIDVNTGGGSGANVARKLNNQHREILFKDADAVIAYNQQFNDKSLGATFFDHLTGNAREVALIQSLGPNPEMTYATLRDTARVRDSKMPGAHFEDGKVSGATRAWYDSDAYYNQMLATGQNYSSFDRLSTGYTAYAAATKLVGTALKAPFQDTPGFLLNAADVGQLSKIGTVLRHAFTNSSDLQKFGIGADQAILLARSGSMRVIGVGKTLAVGNFMNRYAQATMRYTLLDAWTSAMRRAGQSTHALALGEWSNKTWGSLEAGQRDILQNAGITETDWTHITKLPRQKLGGFDIHDVSDIDPAALGISIDDAGLLQSKMMGFVRMGGDIVTSEHNLTSSTVMSAGGRATALNKQMMLFKNAGGAQTAHLLDRLSRKDSASKLAYVGATAAMGVGFGYIGVSAQAAVAGQNPPSLNDWRTIGRAMALTGGFSFLQDLITSGWNAVSGSDSGHSSSPFALVGDLSTVARIVGKSFGDADARRDAGYMALRFGRQQFAPLNYWYTKAIIDHMFYNDWAQSVNSDYTKRLNKYADQKGQQYFWKPNGDLQQPQIGHYKSRDAAPIIKEGR